MKSRVIMHHIFKGLQHYAILSKGFYEYEANVKKEKAVTITLECLWLTYSVREVRLQATMAVGTSY